MAARKKSGNVWQGIPKIALGLAVAMVVGLVGAGTFASAQVGPTVTVTPSSGLADSDTVSVSGSGYAAGASVSIFQCKPAEGCGPVGSAFTDGSGSFGPVSVPVSLTFTATQGASTGLTVSCGPEDNCTINAGDSVGNNDSTGISFASAAPTTVPPTTAPPTTTPTTTPGPAVLNVDPNTGLADSDTVTASGTNFSPGASVTFYQCKLVSGTPQSCGVVGSGAFTDTNGSFGPTSVPVTRTFTATQGVTGQIDCGPEDTCVVLASDAGGKEGSDPISFASVANPNPNGPATLTVNPNSNLAAVQTVTVTGTGFSPSGSISIFECKLNGGGTQSCDLVGTAFSDPQGNFGPTDVTVSREFVSEQGVLGPVSCLPENDCVVYATDPGNRDDAAPITFAAITPPTTAPPTTIPPTTVPPTTTPTTIAPTTTTTRPQSSICNALLSARAAFNATIDSLPFSSFYSFIRLLGNAAFDAALRLNNCNRNATFTAQGAASDARVMQSVLPLRVQRAIQSAPTTSGGTQQVNAPAASPAPSTYTVLPGDTLSRIAARVLGSASQYPQLIASNPALAANPNLIRPGQVLTLA